MGYAAFALGVFVVVALYVLAFVVLGVWAPRASASSIILTVPRLVAAIQGKPYDGGDNAGGITIDGATILYISGGTGPYTCSLNGSTLPSGMSLVEMTPTVYPSGVCVLSGTPTVDGDFPLTIKVSDSSSNTATQSLTFGVLSDNLPSISNIAATSVSPTSEQVTWTSSAPASSMVCYSIGYAVNACTRETDTGGVLSHAVTINGLWPSNQYQFEIMSYGTSGGAPQDYLANNYTAGTFATPAPDNGTTTLFMNLAGPHDVAPGYPIMDGIYYGPALGATGDVGASFTIGGLPPYTKVHWPYQQDDGDSQGRVSTTLTPDDTLTVSGLGGNNALEFELLTNVGGTTPVGGYTLTITGTVFTSTSTISTLDATWSVNVSSLSSISLGSPSSIPAVPDLALWQANMVARWGADQGGTQPQGSWYNGEERVGACEWDSDDQGIQYYDGAWVYDQIGMYNGNIPYWTVGSSTSPCPAADGGNGPQGAAAPAALYHQYLVAENYNVPGFWNFPHGLYYDCTVSGSAQGCTDLHKLADGADGEVTAGRFEPTNIRETSYALGTVRFNYDAGGDSTLGEVQQLATNALGDADSMVSEPTSSSEQPFMDGLLAQALIEYYMDPKTGNHSDPRVLPAIAALANHLWTTEWLPRDGSSGAFLYNLLEENNGVTTESGSDLRNLNLIIAPMYAWLYMETGQPIWQEEGDVIWDSGVTDDPANGLDWSGKNFSQQYRWSFDYVYWRNDLNVPALPSSSPAPQTLTASLAASPSSGIGSATVSLTATTGGTAEGTVTYVFYCNRSDTGTNVTNPADFSTNAVAATSYTAANLCRYASPGNYTAKVIVEQGSASPAQAIVPITVSGSGTITSAGGGSAPAPSVPSGAAPKVSAKITKVTSNSAAITVTSNIPAVIELSYGLTTRYGNTTPASPSLTQVFENLTSLVPNALYDFRIIATANGKTTYSPNQVVKTLSASSTTAKASASPTSLPSGSSSFFQASSSILFSRTLQFGMTGDDVHTLQIILQSLGYLPTSLTPTRYFGSLTKAALMRYERDQKLTQNGILSAGSLSLLNQKGAEILAHLASSTSATPAPQTIPSVPAPASGLIRNLGYGSEGSDVSLLQTLLFKDGDYPQDVISGFYGSLTQSAIARFQSKYGIVSYGSPETTGYGQAGPKTRAALNAVEYYP